MGRFDVSVVRSRNLSFKREGHEAERRRLNPNKFNPPPSGHGAVGVDAAVPKAKREAGRRAKQEVVYHLRFNKGKDERFSSALRPAPPRRVALKTVRERTVEHPAPVAHVSLTRPPLRAAAWRSCRRCAACGAICSAGSWRGSCSTCLPRTTAFRTPPWSVPVLAPPHHTQPISCSA